MRLRALVIRPLQRRAVNCFDEVRRSVAKGLLIMDGEQLGWKGMLWAAQRAESQGDASTAERLYRRALLAARKAHEPAPHLSVAQCCESLATFLQNSDRAAEAQQLRDEAAKIIASLVPPDTE